MKLYALHKYAFAFFIACLSAVSLADQLPDLGDPSSQTLSPSAEYRLGQSAMITIRHAMPLNHDILANNYINSLGTRLQSAEQDKQFAFEFFLVNDDAINAFALPGGFIGINTGLILTTDSEDELASVMSHEMSHVTQRHIARLYAYRKQMTIGTMAGALAAVIIATQNPQAGSGALMATIAGQAQSSLSFSRNNEQEADRVGIQLMSNAGFDPLAMPKFFEKLHQSSRFSGQYVPEYLQTHPLTQSRIADAKNRAQQLPKVPDHLKHQDYWFVKARIKNEQFTMPKDSVAFFEQPLKETAPHIAKLAHQYGLALSLLANNQSDRALSILQTLSQDDPENPYILVALADTYVAQNQLSTAIKLLQQAVKTRPSELALVVALAELQLQAEQPKKAIQLLDQYHLHYGEDTFTLRLISRAYGQAGKPTSMHFYQAKYLEKLGEYHSALDQLKLVKLPQENKDRMSLQIEAKMAEIKEQIENDKKPL